MSVSHHKFSESILQTLLGILESEAQRGTPREFEIQVDGKRIIPRTIALELFDSFKEFLSPESQIVTVTLYRGNSQHNDKYQLYLKQNPLGESGLNGPEMEAQIYSKLKEQEKDFELGGLKKVNKKLKRKLLKKGKYIAKLEEKLMDHQTQKFSLGKLNVGELSSYALEGLLRRNTHWLAGIPGAKALAGAIEADNETQLEGSAPTPQGKAHFQAAQPQLTTEEQIDLETGQQIRQAFSGDHFPQAQQLVGLLSEHPEELTKTLEFLTKQISKR